MSSIVNRAKGGLPELTEQEKAIILDQEEDDNKQVVTTDVVEQEGPGFVDTVGSGLSSIGDYLKERPKENLLSGPTRLQRISDLLIGYSQADPSQPLGTQLGQAAASSSAKQAAERQQRLANILANRRLKAEESLLDYKKSKVGLATNAELNRLLTTFSDDSVKDTAKKELADLYPRDPRVQKLYKTAVGKILPTKPALTSSTTDGKPDVKITDRKKQLGSQAKSNTKQ